MEAGEAAGPGRTRQQFSIERDFGEGQDDILTARCHPSRAVELEREDGGETRRIFHGRTCAGRHLAVVAAPRPDSVMRPITCWELSDKAVRRYEAWRRTVKR
jgi:uncharacterized DUF497 family protein